MGRNKSGGDGVEGMEVGAKKIRPFHESQEVDMSHDSQKTPLTENELDTVAGGGNAIEQIQQVINQADKTPQNRNATLNWLPPNMTTPSSTPYNT